MRFCETKRKAGTVAECDGWKGIKVTEVGNITCGPGISFHSVDVVVVCVFFIITCVCIRLHFWKGIGIVS